MYLELTGENHHIVWKTIPINVSRPTAQYTQSVFIQNKILLTCRMDIYFSSVFVKDIKFPNHDFGGKDVKGQSLIALIFINVFQG